MSNIDTQSIVSQLMAVERRPQLLLQQRVATMKQSQSAWQAIADKLTALKTAADALAPIGSSSRLVTASSSDSAVAVRMTGSAAAMTATIDVVSVAAAHSVVADDVFSGPLASAAGRTLDITIGGALHTFASADGTIQGLADAVNDAGIGVQARVLQTAPGTYQLTLGSTSTGAASAFTAGGSGWAAFTRARAGSDAQIRVDGVLVSRATNTFSDVLDGVELTVSRVTTSPAVVDVRRDDDGIVAKVKALVDAANAALSTLASATRASTEAASRGVLSGDLTARQLMDSIRSATDPALGVSLTRTGTLTFDEATLRAAIADDPDAVLSAISRGGTSTAAGVSLVGSSATASPGPRSVTVTQAATRASLAGVPVPPPAAGSTVSMSVVTPEGTFNISFVTGASWAENAAALNAALRAAGVHITAITQQSGGADVGLDLIAESEGSAQTFSVTGGAAVGLDGAATPGLDAQATVEGVALTAAGRSLVVDGLALSIDISAAELAALGGSSAGVVTLTDGLAGALARIGGEGSTFGAAQRSKSALTDRIAEMEKRIARYDDTLAQRERVLLRRFTAMETMLAQLQTMSTSLGLTMSAAPSA